jgi:hypothetical protein
LRGVEVDDLLAAEDVGRVAVEHDLADARVAVDELRGALVYPQLLAGGVVLAGPARNCLSTNSSTPAT